MNISKILGVLCLTSFLSVFSMEIASAQDKFFCGRGSLGHPATFIRTSTEDVPMINWVDSSFPKPWTPAKRCKEISRKLQFFYSTGQLKYLMASSFRDQPVICVVAEEDGNCLEDGILITLKPYENPTLVLLRIRDRELLYRIGPFDLGGGNYSDKQFLIKGINNSLYINIKKLLFILESNRYE